MAPSTRSGNNGYGSNPKYLDSIKPARKKIKGKKLVRCVNNGKIDQISDDILSEGILSKLPLTSLCTSKCVSKLWNSLIMQNYHQSQRLPIICRIGLSTDPLRLCSVDSNTGTVTPIYNPIHLGPNQLMGPMCSNGFICFYDFTDEQNLVAYNPATQEKVIIHNPNEHYVHHFGFDPCSNKFKVFGWRTYPDCEIYTLGTDSWRKVNSTPLEGSRRRCSMYFCFNGIIYWYSDTGMINFFHLGTESFGVFQGPNSETPIKKVNHIFELEGCLCLAVIRCAPDSRETDKILDLWMLKGQYNVNSGWVLIASVTKPQGKKIFWNCPYLIRTGELLLAHCEEKGSPSFYLYSLFTRQFWNIKICGQESYIVLNNFKENLASLKDF